MIYHIIPYIIWESIMKKKFLPTFLFFLLLCFVSSGSLTSAAEIPQAEVQSSPQIVCKSTFQTVNGKLYYYNSKGQLLKKTWKTINKKRYYFYADGHAATGSSVISKKRYLFSNTGVLLKNGFKTVNGKKYYVNSKGIVSTGFKTIKKKRYCFTSTGVMRTGWYKKGSNSYYFNPKTGIMTTGWKTIDGHKYYFNTNGTMVTNDWVGSKYLDKNGIYDSTKKFTLKKLEKQLRSAMNSYYGTWSIYVKNLDTNETICINNKKIYAASLIKLYAMGAAYDRIKQGRLKESSVSGTINSMITVSSNDAFNSIVRSVGTSYINTWCKANGYNDTNQGHGLSPSSNNYGLSNSSGSNVTTVKDCGKFLESVYRGTCVSKSASKKMLNHLKKQQRRSKIPAGIPKGVTIANKTGETDDTTHDAAIVYSKGADYIICIMANTPGSGWSSASNIPKLSRIVYNYFN